MSAAFGPAEFQARTGADDAAMDRMRRFRARLAEWNDRLNLVGPSALGEFWLRHAFDSAQLVRHLDGARVLADVGAGAGFPGVVLAALANEATFHVHLVESQAKRCRFLEAVVAELALPATVHNKRAETAEIEGVDVVTARACAPMMRLLDYVEPFFRRGASGLFLKGRDVEAELAEARRRWRFEAQVLASASGADGHIVKLRSLKRA